MTDKQLGTSVHHGRRVTFERVSPFPPVTGYLGGIDDVNYLVLVPQSDKVLPVLLNRSSILHITLHPESTLASEPLYEKIDSMLSAFRDWVRRNYLRLDQPKSR